jgi:hypothetical protein
MKTKNTFIILAVGLVIMVFGSLSLAVEGGTKIPLMATKAHPEAMGTAMISNNNISIQANGLKANAVYTAWFVNMKPKKHETGAGDPPYMFKTDSMGSGTYSGSLSESPFGKWQMLMIVLHPNGDPADMKNMVGALSARLKSSQY